ncbi:Fluconazole resistance protein 1 [Verticillium dahliae VDG1]|nr:Fluconazole resistance protein 1 [Verticillium dahliae VDG1]
MEKTAGIMEVPQHEVVVPVTARAAAAEAVEDVVYGSAAGVIGKYIEYPFDTVKVRLQSQPDNLPLRYKGPVDCFRQSIKADGLLGLYRGITAPLVGAAAETSSLFFFERLGREAIYLSGVATKDEPLSLAALYFTGAFSGFFTSSAPSSAFIFMVFDGLKRHFPIQ